MPTDCDYGGICDDPVTTEVKAPSEGAYLAALAGWDVVYTSECDLI
jgi:hypothetical protein